MSIVTKRLDAQKELAKNIKKYDEALLKGEKKEDRKSAIRNKIKADDQHLKVLALGYEFIKSMTEASD